MNTQISVPMSIWLFLDLAEFLRSKGDARDPVLAVSDANTVSWTTRNAWRDLWIKRPADSEWLLADDCRGDGEQG